MARIKFSYLSCIHGVEVSVMVLKGGLMAIPYTITNYKLEKNHLVNKLIYKNISIYIYICFRLLCFVSLVVA